MPSESNTWKIFFYLVIIFLELVIYVALDFILANHNSILVIIIYLLFMCLSK
jgi:hypothetical protein